MENIPPPPQCYTSQKSPVLIGLRLGSKQFCVCSVFKANGLTNVELYGQDNRPARKSVIGKKPH